MWCAKHIGGRCYKQHKDKQMAESSQQQYSPWLKAQTIKFSLFGSKKYGGCLGGAPTQAQQQQPPDIHNSSGTKLGKGEHGQQIEANSKAFNTYLETEDYDDTANCSAEGQNKDHGRTENLQGKTH